MAAVHPVQQNQEMLDPRRFGNPKCHVGASTESSALRCNEAETVSLESRIRNLNNTEGDLTILELHAKTMTPFVIRPSRICSNTTWRSSRLSLSCCVSKSNVLDRGGQNLGCAECLSHR